MSSWQISQNGGTAKDLAAWGICADFAVDLESKAKDTLNVRVALEDVGVALTWAYGDKIKLTDDRGNVVFVGYAGDGARVWDAGREWVEFKVYNVWWLFERLVFKQTRNMFAGYTVRGDPRTPPTFVPLYSSEVYVGEKLDETYQNNGQQVQEVLDWVNQCWNPTRRGATSGIDATQDVVKYPALALYPQVNIPKSRLNGAFCHEAIINVLRYSPDRPVSWDYTTSPPTMNLVNLTAAPEISVTITAAQERQLKAAANTERQLTGVVIRYKRVNVIDGVLWPELFIDRYPATTTDFQPDASDLVVDLVGANVTRVHADVEVRPLSDATGTSAALRKDFWKEFAPELSADGVDDASISIDPATVDFPVDPTLYPNVLLSKAGLADWLNNMGVIGTEATVRAKATFTRYADGTASKKVPAAVHAPKELHVRVVLTNAITTTYSAVQHSEAPETMPQNVAQSVYNSVKDLQYAGTLSLVGDQSRPVGQRDGVRTDIKPGVKLKLVGPTVTFTNCLVQKVRLEPHWGRLTVTFGPSAMLDIQERIELHRAVRLRYTYNMPSGRSNGGQSTGADISMPNQTPKENTTAQHVSDSMVAATAVITPSFTGVVKKEANQQVDPTGAPIAADQVIQAHVVNPATGIRVDAQGAIDMRVNDCLCSDGVRRVIKIREWDICVGGVPKKIRLPSTDAF